jgi:YebC/PmpR family DNA-binding regulatory protein
MAGHSHSANIAHRKGRVDKLRGKLFGKLSRAIIVAAQRGGADPAANMTLRIAIEKARKQSMPKDNIERAIKRGVGDTSGEGFQELSYEGYGPAGVAVICDTLSDNRNRTAGEIRKLFEVHGGNLGATGCVSWMFERKGVFTVAKDRTTEDQLMELALEAGADDVREVGDVFEITCPVDAYQSVGGALEAAKLETSTSELMRLPANVVELPLDDARRVVKLLDALEENDDVQTVTANHSISEDVMAAIVAEEG